MPLPLHDPEFWLVTAGAVLALAYALRRVARSTRAEAERPCDKCPLPTTKRGGEGSREKRIES